MEFLKINKQVQFFLSLFIYLALILLPEHLFAANISLSSGSSFNVGQTFAVNVLVSTESSKPLNAVSATISFPKDKLELISISKTNSIVNFWVEEPSISNGDGSAKIEGVVLNPGWSGSAGRVVTLNFKVKAVGSAIINFSSSSILANDGLGTNILNAAIPVTISLGNTPVNTVTTGAASPGAPLAPSIVSATHPNQNTWYKNNSPKFSWTVPSGVTDVRVLYDNSPVSTPSVEYNSSLVSKDLNDLKDGVYYFHVQFKNSIGWGAIAHFKFQIDSTPPKDFNISLDRKEDGGDSRLVLYFNTSDSLSLISKYVVKVNEEPEVTVLAEEVSTNPYSPTDLLPGDNSIVVTAYDKAGNSKTEEEIVKVDIIKTPEIEDYPTSLQDGDILKIKGKSYPASTVNVYLKDEDGSITKESVKTNSIGNFNLVWSKRLDKGVYTFTVDVVDNKGARSYHTKPLAFEVESSSIYKYSTLLANYLSIGIILIALLALVSALVVYSVYRIKILKKNLQKKVRSIEKATHHDFDLLKEELAEQLMKLQKVKSKRALTKEEDSFLKSFSKYITMVEEDLDQKIDEIEKELE